MDSSRDRKLAILLSLSQEVEPISLSKLMIKLQLDCTDRTVRRWLNQLIKEGLVQKFGHTKEAKYLAIRAKDAISDQMSSFFSSISLKALDWIKRSVFERQPVAYNDEWFDSYDPNVNFYLSSSLRKQLFQSGQRANDHDPAGTYAHQIFNRLLIDLSYNSSRLEGNTYSLLDTERLLLHGDSPEGKLDEEKAMILNHKEAIRYLVNNAPKISVRKEVIYTLHYLLSDGLVEAKYAGKVRDYGVRIGGSTYMPFENSKRLQSQLVKIVQKAALINDPFEQSFFMLVHISYLQAFADVNKRTARLCANIPFITKNLVPLSFNDVEVDAYMSAMIVIYELQEVRPLVDLYVYSYLRTCSAYDVTIKAIGFDEIRVRYRLQRRSLIREIVIENLIGDPLLKYVRAKAIELISEGDRNAFIGDVLEDLDQLDESRISGLGITPQELKRWVALYKAT